MWTQFSYSLETRFLYIDDWRFSLFYINRVGLCICMEGQTFFTAMKVSWPGLTVIPSSSGNGIWCWEPTITLSPADCCRLDKYSSRSMKSSMVNPVGVIEWHAETWLKTTGFEGRLWLAKNSETMFVRQCLEQVGECRTSQNNSSLAMTRDWDLRGK